MSSKVPPSRSFSLDSSIKRITQESSRLDKIAKTHNINGLSVKKLNRKTISDDEASLVNKTIDAFRNKKVGKELRSVNTRLCSDLRAVKSAVEGGKVTTPEEHRKLLAVVDRVLIQLNNVDLERMEPDDPLIDSYLEVIEISYKINDLIQSQKPELFPSPNDARPQPLQGEDGKVRVIRKAPKVERLVLPGGGAKGIGYAPALIALKKAGELNKLKEVAGSSSGALTGLLLASGIRPRKIGKIVDRLEMDEFAGKCEHLKTKYPNVKLSGAGFGATKALELADRHTAERVKKHLDKRWDTERFQKKLKKLETREPGISARLRQLRNQDFEGDRSKQMITFKDLSILHRLSPGKFKELTITGWDRKNKKEVYFNAENTPDISIALAGRLSMAIPGIFRAIELDPGDGGGVRKFCDGGIGSNVPTEAVLVEGDEESTKKMEEVKVRTMVMAFDNSGKVYKTMHEPAEKAKITRVFLKFCAGKYLLHNPEFRSTSDRDKEKIRSAGPNVFVIAHGTIGTTDFKASPQRRNLAKRLATKKAREQIALRKEQAFFQEFENIDALYQDLTDEEKQAIYDSPAPTPTRAGDPNYELEKMLYDRVHQEKGTK